MKKCLLLLMILLPEIMTAQILNEFKAGGFINFINFSEDRKSTAGPTFLIAYERELRNEFSTESQVYTGFNHCGETHDLRFVGFNVNALYYPFNKINELVGIGVGIYADIRTDMCYLWPDYEGLYEHCYKRESTICPGLDFLARLNLCRSEKFRLGIAYTKKRPFRNSNDLGESSIGILIGIGF